MSLESVFLWPKAVTAVTAHVTAEDGNNPNEINAVTAVTAVTALFAEVKRHSEVASESFLRDRLGENSSQVTPVTPRVTPVTPFLSEEHALNVAPPCTHCRHRTPGVLCEADQVPEWLATQGGQCDRHQMDARPGGG